MPFERLLIVLIAGMPTAAPAAASTTATPATAAETAACTAERLRPFVDARGLRQPWPVVPDPDPLPVDTSGGVLIADAGHVVDGFSYWLVVDALAQSAYVVQRADSRATRRSLDLCRWLPARAEVVAATGEPETPRGSSEAVPCPAITRHPYARTITDRSPLHVHT